MKRKSNCLVLTLVFLVSACSSEKSVITETHQPVVEKTAIISSAQTQPGQGIVFSQGKDLPQGKAPVASPGNHLPVIARAQFVAEHKNNADILYVAAKGSDPDGEDITFTYEWKKNGETAGSGDSLTGFKRGDRIAVKVTPFDGRDYGEGRTILTEIGNISPRIMDHRERTFDGTLYRYQVKASDPDGDTLAYALKASPPAMTIDKKTGLIVWTVPSDFKGDAPITVSVTDDYGGEALYNLKITIITEEKEKKK